MSTIEEVKAGLVTATEEANAAIAQTRAANDRADRMIVRLQSVASGTNHAKVIEAVAKAEQCKQRLTEAAMLAQAAAQAARDYIVVLG
jgi:hypothetical protein